MRLVSPCATQQEAEQMKFKVQNALLDALLDDDDEDLEEEDEDGDEKAVVEDLVPLKRPSREEKTLLPMGEELGDDDGGDKVESALPEDDMVIPVIADPISPGENERSERLEEIRNSLEGSLPRGFLMTPNNGKPDTASSRSQSGAGEGELLFLAPPSPSEQAAVDSAQTKLAASKAELESLNATLKDEVSHMQAILADLELKKASLKAQRGG
mmetsp:Transcript_52885/g.112918  ORF Transcript_52885/g.112918 Transcript_52885/m.112918 type:complete len:213 (+) Transcript_52885:130-768(+)